MMHIKIYDLNGEQDILIQPTQPIPDYLYPRTSAISHFYCVGDFPGYVNLFYYCS